MSLFFTCGLPRCGKSTFANKWVSEAPNRVIICSDNIRKALHGQRYEFLAETMVFAIKHVMIRAHLDRGMTVLVDGTHSTDISIRRLLEIDINATPLFFFNVSPNECQKRAFRDKMYDLGGAIRRINDNFAKICGPFYWQKPENASWCFRDYISTIGSAIKERNNASSSLMIVDEETVKNMVF